MKAKEPKFKLGPIQRAWVKALRSGKYKQTKSVLTRTAVGGDSHCCLGVLCDLAAQQKLIRSGHDSNQVMWYCEESLQEALPLKVQNWAGVKNEVGRFGKGLRGSLAGLNDRGSRFKTIANIIEKHAAEIFTRSK